MKKPNVENKRFEELEKQLFKATQVGKQELEEIVSGSNLFDSVMARIESTEEQKSFEPSPSFAGFDWLRGFLTIRRGAVAGVFAVLVLILVNVVWIKMENPKTIAGDKNNAGISEEQNLTQKTTAKVENRGDVVSDPDERIGKALTSQDDMAATQSELKSGKTNEPKMIRKASFEKKQRRPVYKPVRKRSWKGSAKNKRKKPEAKREEEQKIFYQLPFVQNGETRIENLEIVSAELSRAELFALGVNLQLENTVSTIKTELLVGADGVARAIRVVEKF